MLLGVLSLVPTLAQNPAQAEAAQSIISGVAVAEVPSRCAELVAGAPMNEQAAVAASLVQAVAKLHPASLSASVIGISARVPRVAPAAAAAAAELDPSAAPELVASLSSVPGVLRREVLTAVIAAVPGQAIQCLSMRVGSAPSSGSRASTRVASGLRVANRNS